MVLSPTFLRRRVYLERRNIDCTCLIYCKVSIDLCHTSKDQRKIFPEYSTQNMPRPTCTTFKVKIPRSFSNEISHETDSFKSRSRQELAEGVGSRKLA